MRSSSISSAALLMMARSLSSLPVRGRAEPASVTSWPMLTMAVVLGTLLPRHRDVDAFFFGGLLGCFVAGVGVAGYTYAGVVVENAGDFARSEIGAVGYCDLAGVERVAHAYA